MNAAEETCEYCQRSIARQEQAYVLDGKVACEQCNQMLRTEGRPVGAEAKTQDPAFPVDHSDIEASEARTEKKPLFSNCGKPSRRDARAFLRRLGRGRRHNALFQKTREVRSAGSIARHYTVWLLISGLFSHLLSWTLVFVIVWRSRQETETIASTVERGDRLYFGILIAGLTAFFWLWGGWWYGGKRLSRYYVFQSHAEVLNHLALLSIVVMMVSLVGAIASAPGVLLLGNPTFYIPGFVFSLVVWAAIWYGLGWVCLPVGWRCECQQLMEDGKYEKVIDLLTTVATSEELSPEDAHTLDLAEQRFKNSNIAVGNGPESAR